MPKLLTRTQFGNPILRKKAKRLTAKEISSATTKKLIADMRFTLEKKKYGVAIAAPQVGKELAVVVVAIKVTPTRPKLKPHKGVYINPVITKYHGRLKPEWEGCISMGAPSSPIFAQAMRYPKIDISYTDASGYKHKEQKTGFIAHVLQHEIDHLNGVLFVDHVKDTTTYMNVSEYRKRIALKG